MKTRQALLFLLASTFLAANTLQAVPRVIWRIPSDVSAEVGPGTTLFVGTSDATGTTIWSVNQDTSARRIILRRAASSIVSAVATRGLTYSPVNKTLFATFTSPSGLTNFNPLSGSTFWNIGIQNAVFVSEIALTKEGNVILPMQGQGIALLNRNNGRAKWIRRDLNVLTADAPVIGRGGVVFVHSATTQSNNNRSANIAALDSHNGNTLWEFDTGIAKPNSQPVLAPKNVVVVSGDGVKALNANSGKEIWDSGSGPFGKPVIAGSLAVVPGTRQIAGLRLKNGRPRWVRTFDGATCDPVYTTDKLVVLGVASQQQQLQAYDARTGRLKWRLNVGGIVNDITVKGRGRYFCLVSPTGGGASQIVAVRD